MGALPLSHICSVAHVSGIVSLLTGPESEGALQVQLLCCGDSLLPVFRA